MCHVRPIYTPSMGWGMGWSVGRGIAGVGTVGRSTTMLLTAATWAVGGLVTLLIVLSPVVLFGYHSPSLHLVLESVDGCIALLVAYLLYGRFRRSRRAQDLLLAEGLVLLTLAGIGLTLLLEVLGNVPAGTVDAWLPQLVRVIGALFVLAAALAGPRPVAPGWSRWALLVPWGVLAVALASLWLARDLLPLALAQSEPSSADRPVLTGHPLLLAAMGLSAVAYVVASLSFTSQAADRPDDELLRWLAPATALMALSRIHYVLFPSIYSDWLYTGDLFRTACYLVLLVGAGREIGQYWSAQASAAILDDRRRVARELHDGVVQELTYIRNEARGIPTALAVSQRILGSCDRALDEARAAVDALGRGDEEPLGSALRRAAREVAERFGRRIDVDVDDTVGATGAQRHALTRVAREAVTNALRHGEADRILLRLAWVDGARRLTVLDDGRGFDLETQGRGGTGYGLTSMRERAQALPGSFTLRSAPGEGTTVDVTW